MGNSNHQMTAFIHFTFSFPLSLSLSVVHSLSVSNPYHLYSIQITTRFIVVFSLCDDPVHSLSLSCFVPRYFPSSFIHSYVLRYQIQMQFSYSIPRFGVYFL